jgi:hypothetical protein
MRLIGRNILESLIPSGIIGAVFALAGSSITALLGFGPSALAFTIYFL